MFSCEYFYQILTETCNKRWYARSDPDEPAFGDEQKKSLAARVWSGEGY